MANPLERESADTVAAELLLTELLREVADLTSSPSVRKTTLSALLAAIEEEGGGPAEYDVPLNRLSGSGLGDARPHASASWTGEVDRRGVHSE